MRRFFRLDTAWHTSEWIVTLSAEARLAWVLLLGYAKANGFDGKVKALRPLVAARLWYVGEESVTQMLLAAEKHGALELNLDEWTVTKWRYYQGDVTGSIRQQRHRERNVTRNDDSNENRNEPLSNAERQRRFRERRSGSKSEPVTESNAFATQYKTREENTSPPLPPSGDSEPVTQAPVRKVVGPKEAEELSR